MGLLGCGAVRQDQVSTVIDMDCVASECRQAIEQLEETDVPISELGYGAVAASGERIWFYFDIDGALRGFSDGSAGDGEVVIVVDLDQSTETGWLTRFVRCRAVGDEVIAATCAMYEGEMPDRFAPQAHEFGQKAVEADGALTAAIPLVGTVLWWSDETRR